MTLQFGPDAARRVETSYLSADVVAQRRRVLEALRPRPGETAVDIGCGPGLLSVELAAAVGPEGSVLGTDISPSMLALAEAREIPTGASPLRFARAGVDALPIDDSSADLAVCTQVLEYVADIPAALTEMHRVLRPDGRLLLLDTDWGSLVWHSTDVERMRRVCAVWDEHLVDPYLPRTLLGSLQRAGFEVDPPWTIPLLNVGYHEATYSGGLIPTIQAFVADRGGLAADEAAAWAADLRALGPAYFFSLNRYVFLARRPR